MKTRIIYTGSQNLATPDGVVGPFETAEVGETWLRRNPSHRIKTPNEYNAMLEGLDHDELVDHAKKRRQLTDEDLDAQGTAEELREQMRLASKDAEPAAE